MLERKTITARVAEHILDMLNSGELAPGQRLRQEKLAAEIGVSSVPVREALISLSEVGLCVYEPHRGARVRDLDEKDISELYDLREILERRAEAAGVPKLTALDRMQLLAAQMEAIEPFADRESLLSWLAANREFHLIPLRAAGMPHTMRLIDAVWKVSGMYRYFYLRESGNRSSTEADHRRLIKAATAGDAEGYSEIMAQHRERTLQAIRSALRRGDPS